MTHNTISWDTTRGIITLKAGDRTERLILQRRGFLQSFLDEIEKAEGKNAVTMTLRSLLTTVGSPKADTDNPTYGHVRDANDKTILPISTDGSTIPDLFQWDGKTRDLIAFGNTPFSMLPLRFLQAFKDASISILTEHGARAILNTVTRRAGYAVGQRACENYNWNDLEGAMASMDGVLSNSFPFLGWGRTRIATKMMPDGMYMFYLKCWDAYESDGVTSDSPTCFLFQKYLEGLGAMIAETYIGDTTESKEVMCSAAGDECCAFAIKQKKVGSGPLDWNELEEQWRELDNLALKPE
ncbi:MAG: 4-vinyl reductase [Deltaproteobacteria bacterium]|nr:4-vinyl reductase [Candidatus Zymogenaceae bacterium]